MKRNFAIGSFSLIAAVAVLTLAGCNNSATKTSDATDAGSGGAAAVAGTFTLAWSEYPSWSVFGVAEEKGLLDGKEGAMGTLEKKHGVDVVLKALSYDGCLGAYSSGTTDAVCITNMDILSPSLGRTSVAIFPTSTSDGADACIVNSKINSVEELKGKTTWGFEQTVSQYMFERVLEVRGFNPAEFPFKMKDPEVAAQAMQTKDPDTDSIVVWNPFVIQTLRVLDGEAKVLFDSTVIPEEIIDMVVIGEDSLKKEGGAAFAQAIAEAFYEVNNMIEDPATRDDTLIALGKKFGNLELEDMKTIVQQTKFYKTPAAGTGLFERADFQSTLMPRVIDFCESHKIVDTKPTVGYKAGGGEQLQFDTTYMSKAAGN